MSPNPPRTENVYLFIPNLIGYTRITLALASLHYMPYHPLTCATLYTLSCLLDAIDGLAARHLHQSTHFGAVLDMLTDRCTTSCLLVFLATAFPRWSILFQGLISLDYSSHYIHMYATLAMGGNRKSHKEIGDGRHWALRVYYSNTVVLFITCFGNELFFLTVYLLSFSMEAAGGQVWASPWSAGAMERARANKVDQFIPGILLWASAPVMVFKQYVNVIQLVEGSRWLVRGDREYRREMGLVKKRVE